MQIVVTDSGAFWNHNNPLLEKYADCVLLVCLQGKKVSDQYRCFISPYKPLHVRGMVDLSLDGQLYRALASKQHLLAECFDSNEDILFLTDSNPQSLFPYLVLKRTNHSRKLHLWCMPPLKFEGLRRKAIYDDLLNDCTQLVSLLYMDETQLRKNMPKTMAELIESVTLQCEKLLPVAVCDISHGLVKEQHYYFDFYKERYLPVKDAYTACVQAAALPLHKVASFQPSVDPIMYLTMGYIYSDAASHSKEAAEQLYPRPDGKQICEQLKKLRIILAEANDLDYQTVDCPSQGPCAGTCLQCDKELRELKKLLDTIPQECRYYPQVEISRAETPYKEGGF